MNDLGEFIKSKRLGMDLSLREFAKLCDLSHTHIDSIEKGLDYRTGKPVRVTNDTLAKIANAINVDPSLLFDLSLGIATDGKENPVIRVPVLGRIVAGIPLEAITEIIDFEEIPRAIASKGEYFALLVKGNSMEPRIRENDVVIVKKQSTVDSGELAIVLINGHDATLKKVTRQDDGILLTAFNPEVYSPCFYSNEQILKLPVEILGKVVELRGKF